MKSSNVLLISFVVVGLVLIFCGNEVVYANETRYFPVYTGNVYDLKDHVSGLNSIVSTYIYDETIVTVDTIGLMEVLQPGETYVE